MKVIGDDILIISDSDEIPSHSAVRKLKYLDWQFFDVFELIMIRNIFSFRWRILNFQSQVSNARRVSVHLQYLKIKDKGYKVLQKSARYWLVGALFLVLSG